MQLYFALLIVLLICLVYDHRLFLVVLLGSIILAPMSRYLGGDGFRCSKDCEYDADGNPKTDPDVYANQKSCLIDCQKLVDIEFEPPVPYDFLMRISSGGDLENKYKFFKTKSDFIDSMMEWMTLDSNIGNSMLKLIIKERGPCVYNVKKHDIYKDIKDCTYVSKEILNDGNQSVWNAESIEILKHLPIDQYQFIILPIAWFTSAGGHIITGLADIENKIIHIIDSNISAHNEEWERTLYNNLLIENLQGFSLNWSNDYWKDEYLCPRALQKAMPTGGCQTWRLYTALLYIFNIRLPKKELIHILSIIQDKSPELLTQLLFYIEFLTEEHTKRLSLDENAMYIHVWMTHVEKNKRFNKSRIDAGYFISERTKEIQQSDWYKLQLRAAKLPDILEYINSFVIHAGKIDSKLVSINSTYLHQRLLHNFVGTKENFYFRFKSSVKWIINYYKELLTKIPKERLTELHRTVKTFLEESINNLNKILEDIENRKDELISIKYMGTYYDKK